MSDPTDVSEHSCKIPTADVIEFSRARDSIAERERVDPDAVQIRRIIPCNEVFYDICEDDE